MKPIHLRNVPPPLETFDHISFLENIASWIKPERYLELGVRSGSSFVRISGHCKEAWGVDLVEPNFQVPDNGKIYIESTDSFFRGLEPDVLFDMVFIDADHSHEQSLKDFLNVKDRVIYDGFVFLHDTYPYDEGMTIPTLSDKAYKTALWIKSNLIKDWECVTLPFNPGLTILKRMDQNKQLLWER